MMFMQMLVNLLTSATSLEISTSSKKTTLIETQTEVNHIEPDTLELGRILFTDKCSVWTTDGITARKITGNVWNCGLADGHKQAARFQLIGGFVQRNASQLIVTDAGNHCLRLVDRISNLRTGFAGTCQSSGYRNGEDSLFANPTTIITDLVNPNQIIVCDLYNSALRIVDNTYLHTSTMVDLDIASEPLRMVQIGNGNIYISVKYGILKFDYCKKTSAFVAGSTKVGFLDGPPLQSLFGLLKEVVELAPNKLLVADYWNNRLRLINFDTNVTWSICTGGPSPSKSGNLTDCWLRSPQALAIINNTIYIGELGRISIIQGSLLTTEIPTTTTAGLTSSRQSTPPPSSALQQKDLSVIYVGLCILTLITSAILVMSCKRNLDGKCAKESDDAGTAVQMSQTKNIENVGTSEADPQYECPDIQLTHPYGDRSNSHVYTSLEG